MQAAHELTSTESRPRGWQPQFLELLPAVERHVRHELRKTGESDPEEALQATIAYAAVAFARLSELNKCDCAFAAPLARYGLKHYRAGRMVGGRLNSRDIGSRPCCRRQGCIVESLGDWHETLAESRHSTPAEIAGFRIDFGEWLASLSARNRKLATALASGEETRTVASMFRVTSGRVSQLRRELHASWLRFVGEPLPAAVE